MVGEEAQLKVSEPEAPADPDAEYKELIRQAKQAVASGRDEDSMTSYRAALALKPDSLEAKQGLGFALVVNGTQDSEFREAISLLEQVVGESAGDARAWFALGLAYQETSRDKNALRAYEKYLQLEPDGKFAADVREAIKLIKKSKRRR